MPAISYDPERFLPAPDKSSSSDKSKDQNTAYGQFQQALNQQSANTGLAQAGQQTQALSQQFMNQNAAQSAFLSSLARMGGGGGGGGGTVGGGPRTPSPGGGQWDPFFNAFAQAEGFQLSPQALDFMRRWNRAEGNGAAWNPWNTTQRAPGSTSFNSVGVQNFPNMQTAVNAYVGLFNRNPNWYGAILSALRGTDEMAMARAVKASPWGTSNIMNVM